VTADSLPQLLIYDSQANLCTERGVERIATAETCEGFPWAEDCVPKLSEDEILQLLIQGVEAEKWQLTPEKDEDGCIGYFCNKKNFVPMGITDSLEEEEGKIFCGRALRPWVEFDKAAAAEQIRKMGFASDFDPAKKEINKFPGEKMLLINDPKKLWGNGMNMVLVVTQDKYAFYLWKDGLGPHLPVVVYAQRVYLFHVRQMEPDAAFGRVLGLGQWRH